MHLTHTACLLHAILHEILSHDYMFATPCSYLLRMQVTSKQSALSIWRPLCLSVSYKPQTHCKSFFLSVLVKKKLSFLILHVTLSLTFSLPYENFPFFTNFVVLRNENGETNFALYWPPSGACCGIEMISLKLLINNPVWKWRALGDFLGCRVSPIE